MHTIVFCSLQEKLSVILSLTYQHARNLALLATIYKASTMLAKKGMGHSSPLVTFLAAAVAGYTMFGSNNKLNMQVSGVFLFGCKDHFPH